MENQLSLFETKKVSGLNGTIAQEVLKHLRDGWSAKEALELTLKRFPNAKTSIKCVYWYASKAGIKLSAKKYEEAIQS